jgi:hydrogenase maturation protease
MNINDDGAGIHLSGTIKVIGIGQSLRGDDAAGLAAVRLWEKERSVQDTQTNVQVELEELPGIGLLNLLEGTSFAILVDAVRSAAPPGTIHRLAEHQLESFQSSSGSAHGWGVAETLTLGRTLFPQQMPAKLLLIGIEAGQLQVGETLSPEVEASLPEVAQLIEQQITAYRT